MTRDTFCPTMGVECVFKPECDDTNHHLTGDFEALRQEAPPETDLATFEQTIAELGNDLAGDLGVDNLSLVLGINEVTGQTELKFCPLGIFSSPLFAYVMAMKEQISDDEVRRGLAALASEAAHLAIGVIKFASQYPLTEILTDDLTETPDPRAAFETAVVEDMVKPKTLEWEVLGPLLAPLIEP